MRLEQFAVNNTINYDEMDTAQRANLLNYIDAIADNIELDLDDPDFSVAEKVAACEDAAAAMLNEDIYTPEGEQVTIDDDTQAMLVTRLEVALLRKYNLPLD